MDQTPFPLESLTGCTHHFSENKTLWQMALRTTCVKWQAKLLITTSADGKKQFISLLISQGVETGKAAMQE